MQRIIAEIYYNLLFNKIGVTNPILYCLSIYCYNVNAVDVGGHAVLYYPVASNLEQPPFFNRT